MGTEFLDPIFNEQKFRRKRKAFDEKIVEKADSIVDYFCKTPIQKRFGRFNEEIMEEYKTQVDGLKIVRSNVYDSRIIHIYIKKEKSTLFGKMDYFDEVFHQVDHDNISIFSNEVLGKLNSVYNDIEKRKKLDEFTGKTAQENKNESGSTALYQTLANLFFRQNL